MSQHDPIIKKLTEEYPEFKDALKVYTLCTKSNKNHLNVRNFLSRTKGDCLSQAVDYLDSIIDDDKTPEWDIVAGFHVLAYIVGPRGASTCAGATMVSACPSK